jgi:hypothetical protein
MFGTYLLIMFVGIIYAIALVKLADSKLKLGPKVLLLMLVMLGVPVTMIYGLLFWF